MTDFAFQDILHGADPMERVVAVEPDLYRGIATLYVREKSGETMRVARPFVPWMLTQDEKRFFGAQTTRLVGDGYCWRIDFKESGWKGFLDARRELRDQHCSMIAYSSPTKQFLMDSGVTLFKGMAFDDIVRMQLDLETRSLDPNAPGAGIFIVSLSDSTGRIEALVDSDEARLLTRAIEMIREWNPDVIEGHNFYGFDLPYLSARCAQLGVELRLGRDNSLVSVEDRRSVSIGPFSRTFAPYRVHGRHIIDTYFSVQRFDQSRGGLLSSYALKECAKSYGFASADRVYVDRSKIAEIYARSPQEVIKYASQDVEETRDLSALTTPSEFYQTQMVPETYQNSALVGTGEKIDSLMIRQYLRMGYAPALALPPREFGGGYTEARKTGVIAPVVKADVESLYPSIMLTQKIKPQSDTLNAFLPMLSELTHRRLEAKAQVKTFPEHSRERSYWDGLQSSFKVLINSFYGYVGGPFHFNDYEAASAVTEKGRELVKKIADEIERAGGEPIEIDTDGVYFKPPANVESVEDEELYIEQIGSVLPAGIRLAHDGRYRAMLSLKIKNYVLVDYTGKRIVRGSSLRSRADELFGREFLGKAIDLLLENKKSEIARLYSAEVDRILNGKLSLDEIVRRERVTAKMLTSSLRRRAASAIKSGDFKEGDIVYLYQRSDGALAVKEDYKNDEDRAYYVEKLHKFALRLSSALSANELAELFPSPTDRKARSLGAQTSLDL